MQVNAQWTLNYTGMMDAKCAHSQTTDTSDTPSGAPQLGIKLVAWSLLGTPGHIK